MFSKYFRLFEIKGIRVAHRARGPMGRCPQHDAYFPKPAFALQKGYLGSCYPTPSFSAPLTHSNERDRDRLSFDVSPICNRLRSWVLARNEKASVSSKRHSATVLGSSEA